MNKKRTGLAHIFFKKKSMTSASDYTDCKYHGGGYLPLTLYSFGLKLQHLTCKSFSRA